MSSSSKSVSTQLLASIGAEYKSFDVMFKLFITVLVGVFFVLLYWCCSQDKRKKKAVGQLTLKVESFRKVDGRDCVHIFESCRALENVVDPQTRIREIRTCLRCERIAKERAGIILDELLADIEEPRCNGKLVFAGGLIAGILLSLGPRLLFL